MKKYWVLLQLSWQNGFVYRISLLMWRIRRFLYSLMALSVWSSIFTNNASVAGYTNDQMTAYILLTSFLQSVVLSSVLNGLSNDVYSGRISQYLLKPQSLFGYFAMLDTADKIKGTVFTFIEVVLLLWLFQPELVLPSLAVSVMVIIMTLMATALNFAISMLFGAMGFWTPDVWGPRFIFFMIVQFAGGQLFPLDILPKFMQTFFYLTPFPYLTYVQSQAFLGNLTWPEMWLQLGLVTLWAVGLWLLAQAIWKKGLKDYAAAGL